MKKPSIQVKAVKSVVQEEQQDSNVVLVSFSDNKQLGSDHKRYEELDNFDLIDSKEIIICLNRAELYKRGNKEITSKSIMLEIRRLLLRCFKDEKCNEKNISSAPSILDIVRQCVEYIVENRVDNDGYYECIINHSLSSILDIEDASMISNEAKKLFTFVEYFIDSFTDRI